MSRRSGATNAGQEETTVKPKDQSQDKQAMLLSQDVGHFSLVKYTLITPVSAYSTN